MFKEMKEKDMRKVNGGSTFAVIMVNFQRAVLSAMADSKPHKVRN